MNGPAAQNVPAAIGAIVQLCADHFQVTARDIHSARRDAPIALARHVAFFLARELTDASLPRIARSIGDRDHTSVLHGVRRIQRLMRTDASLAARVSVLRDLARARTIRRLVIAPDDGVATARVICDGLANGAALPQTRAALLDLAIAALNDARAMDEARIVDLRQSSLDLRGQSHG